MQTSFAGGKEMRKRKIKKYGLTLKQIEAEEKKKKKKKKHDDKRVKVKRVKLFDDIVLTVSNDAVTNFKLKTSTTVKNTKTHLGVSGGKRGFAKVKLYKKANLKHAMHLLRLDTERQLANRPEMLLSTDESMTERQIQEQILRMHEFDDRSNSKGGRRCLNAYVEIFCAFESLELLKQYMKELEARYNTNVFAVIHDDESVEHVHILISYKNKENKALRLHKSEFSRLWRETIRKLQPSRNANFRTGEGMKAFQFYQYRKAYLHSQEAYDNFVNYTREQRMNFYDFEFFYYLYDLKEAKRKLWKLYQENQQKFFDYIDELQSRRVAEINTNDSLYNFTVTRDTTTLEEIEEEEEKQEFFSIADALSHIDKLVSNVRKTEDNNETTLREESIYDIMNDDITTAEAETFNDILRRKEEEYFEKVREIEETQEEIKQEAQAQQQERQEQEIKEQFIKSTERHEREEVNIKHHDTDEKTIINDFTNSQDKDIYRKLSVYHNHDEIVKFIEEQKQKEQQEENKDSNNITVFKKKSTFSSNLKRRVVK